MQHHFPILFENVPEETLRWEELFSVECIQVNAEGDLVLTVSQLEK